MAARRACRTLAPAIPQGAAGYRSIISSVAQTLRTRDARLCSWGRKGSGQPKYLQMRERKDSFNRPMPPQEAFGQIVRSHPVMQHFLGSTPLHRGAPEKARDDAEGVCVCVCVRVCVGKGGAGEGDLEAVIVVLFQVNS